MSMKKNRHKIMIAHLTLNPQRWARADFWPWDMPYFCLPLMLAIIWQQFKLKMRYEIQNSNWEWEEDLYIHFIL